MSMKAKIGDFLKIHGQIKRIINADEFDRVYLLEDGSFALDSEISIDQVKPESEIIK